MNLFVLVSTGQNVANLPPVLELAHPGDHIVWLESDAAAEKGWAIRATSVLTSRGLAPLPAIRVGDENDPTAYLQKLPEHVRQWTGQYQSVYAVANGGRKLSPVGLLRALEPLNPVLLYGDEAKTRFSASSELHSATAPIRRTTEPYERHALDLPDILEVNGSQIVVSAPEPATRIWARTHLRPLDKGLASGLPDTVVDERYGIDPRYTFDLHAEHHNGAIARKLEEKPQKKVNFDEAKRLVPSAFAKWLSAINEVRELDDEGAWQDDEKVKILYGATLNLEEKARKQARSAQEPSGGLGKPFERAVARRVRDWLETRKHPAVQSAWMNVEIQSPPLPEQQLDVVLVLRNAILIHLECKAAIVDVGDLDRRLLRLQRAASRPARLVVVLPSYAGAAGEPWTTDVQQARDKATDGGIQVVPFTLRGMAGLGTKPEYFEDALDDLLRPYHP